MIITHEPVSQGRVTGVAKRYGKRWAHLGVTSCSDVPKLHAFAGEVGLRRVWFQCAPRNGTCRPHYDMVQSRFDRAVALGVRVLSLREFARAQALCKTRPGS